MVILHGDDVASHDVRRQRILIVENGDNYYACLGGLSAPEIPQAMEEPRKRGLDSV